MLCTLRQELSNERLLIEIGFDRPENERCEVCPISVYRSSRCHVGHAAPAHLGHRRMYLPSLLQRPAPLLVRGAPGGHDLHRQDWGGDWNDEIGGWNQLQTFGGHLSAISRTIILRNCAFFTIFRDHLQDVHTFEPLRSQNFRKTSTWNFSCNLASFVTFFLQSLSRFDHFAEKCQRFFWIMQNFTKINDY